MFTSAEKIAAAGDKSPGSIEIVIDSIGWSVGGIELVRGHLLRDRVGFQVSVHGAMDLIRDPDDAGSMDGKTQPYRIGRSKDQSQLGIETKALGSIFLRISIRLEIVVRIAGGIDLAVGLLPRIA